MRRGREEGKGDKRRGDEEGRGSEDGKGSDEGKGKEKEQEKRKGRGEEEGDFGGILPMTLMTLSSTQTCAFFHSHHVGLQVA